LASLAHALQHGTWPWFVAVLGLAALSISATLHNARRNR
jgi:hypothetical protein